MKFKVGDRVSVYGLVSGDQRNGITNGDPATILEIKASGFLVVRLRNKFSWLAHPKQCRKLKKRTSKDFSSYSYHVDFSKEPKQKASLAVGDIVKVVGEITELHSTDNCHFCHIRTPNDRFIIAISDVEKIGGMEKSLQINPDGTVKRGSVF